MTRSIKLVRRGGEPDPQGGKRQSKAGVSKIKIRDI